MKTLSREEVIIEMVINKKQVTSDEFTYPDISYCVYDDFFAYPFRFIDTFSNYTLDNAWDTKTWRLRKYIPKDKELVFCWDDSDKATVTIRYYDAKNNSTFNHKGNRFSINFHNYTPYTGELPPNMCTVEELEE